MTSLMQGFHIAYGLPGGRPFLRERAIAILLVFSPRFRCWLLPCWFSLRARALRSAYCLGWRMPGEDLRGSGAGAREGQERVD